MTVEHRSERESPIRSYWSPLPEVRPICVTGVVAMYAHKSHFVFLLPQPSNLPLFPTVSPIKLVCFHVAIEAFKHFASSFLHLFAPRQLAGVVPHYLTLRSLRSPETTPTHRTKQHYYLAIMSFIARNNVTEGDDHRSRMSIYEDDNADQHEEHQSSRSELPAEIPDSQPDPYLPAEIPDSQPDVVYHDDLPFGDPDYSEVLSQLTTPDHGDLQLGEADAFDLGDYDLGEEEAINPGDCHLDNRENIDSRVNRFDRLRREEINKGFYDEAVSSSSSDDTEVIPGGTRLTERFKDRLVSLYHHLPIPTTLLSICLQSSRSQ